MVLIRKLDGSIQYCLDYGNLNDLAVKDSYHLPLIEMCLDTLSGKNFFQLFIWAMGIIKLSLMKGPYTK